MEIKQRQVKLTSIEQVKDEVSMVLAILIERLCVVTDDLSGLSKHRLTTLRVHQQLPHQLPGKDSESDTQQCKNVECKL